MKKQNNKGAAMVSVLIAVTFIAILGSSMLYMAYMNYKTKAMRYGSANNFYSDEFSLDEIASSLQQTAASADSIDDAKHDIAALIGGSTSSNGVGTYDPAKVNDLIRVSNQSGVDITVGTQAADCVLEIKDNQVVLRNLNLICQDSSTGYYSSITTDMEINFNSTYSGDFDVNDFSVIAGEYLQSSNKSGTTLFSGCLYMRHANGDSNGLVASSGRAISILSPKAIIDGDLVVKDTSGLYIGGDVNVNGDLIVDKGAYVIVSGTLNLSGTVKAGSGGLGTIASDKGVVQVGSVPNNCNIKENVEKIKNSLDAIPESMAEALFAQHLYVRNNSGDVIDLGGGYKSSSNPLDFIVSDAKQSKHTDNLTGFRTDITQNGNGNGNNPFEYPRAYLDNGKMKGPEYYFNMVGLPDQTDNGFDYCLALTTHSIKLKYDHYNTTFLTTGNINYNENGTTQMSNMPDSAYQACLETFLCLTKQIGNGDVKFAGGASGNVSDWDQFVGMIKGTNGYTMSDYTVYEYNAEDGTKNKLTTAQRNNLEENDIQVGSATRYLVFDGQGSLYVPVGYFLAPNTADIIAKYFALGNTEDDPTNNCVAYVSWSKD